MKMNPESSTPSTPSRCRGRMKYVAAVLVVLAVAGAGLAWAGQKAVTSLASHHAGGLGFGGRFARLHVEFAVDRALRIAQASPEQREKVGDIVEKAFADHQHFRDEHKALRVEALAVLSAPSIDRTRLEALRAHHMQIAEEASRQVTTVVADIADVLTPDQRQRLAAHVQQMFE